MADHAVQFRCRRVFDDVGFEWHDLGPVFLLGSVVPNCKRDMARPGGVVQHVGQGKVGHCGLVPIPNLRPVSLVVLRADRVHQMFIFAGGEVARSLVVVLGATHFSFCRMGRNRAIRF